MNSSAIRATQVLQIADTRSISGVIVLDSQIVEVGTKGFVGEEFFPPARRQLLDLGGGEREHDI
jgi:hypothetical protein